MSDPAPEAAVFAEALAVPLDERAAFLDRACAGDAGLRASVEQLLKASDQAGNFLEATPVDHLVPSEEIGARIDRYRLLEKIGEGGCGAVYRAEQEHPVRRQIALKVIKLGMDTQAVIARFEAERQALAMMDHPNIARVLDAGATTSGRPYFVMELVQGVRITDYCDQQRLSTADRLALFTHVCHAIEHAHQKGIIHRDIKPSNILVAQHDGRPVPKVIDFGIAKATQGRLTDHTVFTAFEQFVGTPAYMSPEQALGGIDVDTRSDIYSLGVLLYELLAGAPPFDPRSLREAGLDEVRRIIREVDPPRPSTRFSTLADADRNALARQRELAPGDLSKVLRGDLDWIVMRCLEKARDRRYATASALATDIARHLDHEPVLARPPSSVDRIRKLVTRHQLAFASAAALATLLVAGLALSTWQYYRERAALARALAAEKTQSQLAHLADVARLAEARQRTLAEAARANEAQLRATAEEGQARARNEATRSAQVAKLIADMLKNVGPHVAQGRDTTLLREVLDTAAQRLDTELAAAPEVELELRDTLADVYVDLGEYARAVKMRRRVLALREARASDDPAPYALAWVNLGRALLSAGDTAEAESAFRTALTLQEKADHVRAHSTRGLLAIALSRQGRTAEAEALQREVLATNREQRGEHSVSTLGATVNLAGQLSRQGRKTEAEALLRQVLAVDRTQLDADDLIAGALNTLSSLLSEQGKLDEAATALRDAIALRQKKLGPDHVDLTLLMINLANVLRRQNAFEPAEQIYRAALATQRKVLGEAHPSLHGTLTNLGSMLQGLGRHDEARSLFQESLAIQRNLPSASGAANALLVLAQLEENVGNRAVAERHFREAVELFQQSPRPSPQALSAAEAGLARTLRPAVAPTAPPPSSPAKPTAKAGPNSSVPSAAGANARSHGADMLSIVSVTPITAPARLTEFVVRVRYRLGSTAAGRISLSFNTRGPNQFVTVAEKLIQAGEGELELKAKIAPVIHADGAAFAATASLWPPEARAAGTSSLATVRRTIEVQ